MIAKNMIKNNFKRFLVYN